MFKLTGKVVFVGEEQVINEKFKKRDFVVEDASAQYPQTIQFQAVQDKCDILNTVKINDVVAVSFNLKGRPWVSNIFHMPSTTILPSEVPVIVIKLIQNP